MYEDDRNRGIHLLKVQIILLKILFKYNYNVTNLIVQNLCIYMQLLLCNPFI
jgi:hypothetical protein